jgi:pimeloyl-ACP methyl ester carboxylesterase
VSKIVGVDIGDPKSLQRSMRPKEAAAVLAYQLCLALAWIVGGSIGDWMTRAMARWARCPSDRRYMSSRMDYPYFLTWFGGRRSYRHQLQRFRPACPMLFVFGSRKPFMFHAKAWTDELLARKANQVVKFDTGHWVMSAQPEQFNRVVIGWLSR